MREQNIIHTDSSIPFRRVLSASTLAKDSVRNRSNENVGSIREIMIDVPSGRVAYAALAVGGFLGLGERLFAIPWQALTLDEDNKCFILDVDKERLMNAPGFDKDHWPDMTNPSFTEDVSDYWGESGAPASTPPTGGSGDYSVEAGRRYDGDTAALSDSEVEVQAREARRVIDSPEGADLRQAEVIGKSRIK
ncbi:MAG TPA: PRC-barrel domain-containing protein [Candidatus Binataceae bacterium]|nr:PRC-barrel domain-containing protein [Candidatus Binataceae bacterium]